MRAESPAALLRVSHLSKSYVQRGWFSRKTFLVQALDDVSLTISPGSTLALVGESGSGKSTLARCLVRLEEPSTGEIWFEGTDLARLQRQGLFEVRQRIQLIFQDPAVSLNPRLTAAEVVAEPLVIQGRGTRQQRRARALELIAQVGIPPQHASRRPLEFSGGQRQRLAIARALAVEPKFLILDEALSALDLSVQAQIVNLLQQLQAVRSLTYLYISHDLSLVGYLADEVAVMQHGRIVEHAGAAELFARPQHPYTRALLAAMPVLDPRAWTTGQAGSG